MSLKGFFLTWGMLAMGVAMNVLGMLLIKMKMNDLGAVDVGSFRMAIGYFFALLRSPIVIIGGILFVLASFPLTVAVSRMEMTIAYPLSIALSCLMIVPLSILFLGEALTSYKLTAMIIIIVSMYLLYKK